MGQIHFNAAVEPGLTNPRNAGIALCVNALFVYTLRTAGQSKIIKIGRGVRIYNLFLKLVARNFWFDVR